MCDRDTSRRIYLPPMSFSRHLSSFYSSSFSFLPTTAPAMYIPGALRLSSYVLPFLSSPYPPTQSSPKTSTISFKPVHAHGHAFVDSASTPTLFLYDHSPSTSLYAHDYPIGTFGDDRVISLESDTLEIRTRKQLIRRPKVRPPRITSWAQSYRVQALNANGINTSLPEYWLAPDLTDPSDEWSDVEVTVPDLTDRQTVLALAKMTSNAYVTPGGAGWYPLEGWNASTPFGWEPDADGLRGHVVSNNPLRVDMSNEVRGFSLRMRRTRRLSYLSKALLLAFWDLVDRLRRMINLT